MVVLDRVQKEIVEPFNQSENLKHNISTNLARHHQHLQEVQELVNTAKNRTNHTGHLLRNIHTNLEAYTVSCSLQLGVWSDSWLFIMVGFISNGMDKYMENNKLSSELIVHECLDR